jgi:hypothetical protein
MLSLYVLGIGVAWWVHPDRRKAKEEARKAKAEAMKAKESAQ